MVRGDYDVEAEKPSNPDGASPKESEGGSPAGNPGTSLSVSNFERSYGAWKAVRNVSFALEPGLTGLLGPNGAGKTSLLSCLAGIAPWNRGEIKICGIDLGRHPRDARRNIGFMPERVAFPNEMRVEQYVEFAASVKGLRGARRDAAVDVALDRCGLGDVGARVVGNLSKGYRQRVGLAQALVGEPPIAILDEPTAGMDPLNVFAVRDLLQDYAGAGRIVLVSTHHLPDARLMCDRVLVMAKGVKVYDGTPSGMAVDGDRAVRLRIRLKGEGEAPVIPSDMKLVTSQTVSGELILVLDAPNETRVGQFIRSIGGSWLPVAVEPTMDALEEAFRQAVIGTPSIAEEHNAVAAGK